MQKNTFIVILLITSMVLVFLPFTSMFTDLLTRLLIYIHGYELIQLYIVPWEVRMVGVFLLPFGLQPAVMGEYLALATHGGNPFLIEIAWNCIGWQSLLFFFITALVGFQGEHYARYSKFKSLMIGVLGTFLVNLVRIAIIAVVAYYLGQGTAQILHDYGSTLFTLGWLFFFWWFCYAFVLDERYVV